MWSLYSRSRGVVSEAALYYYTMYDLERHKVVNLSNGLTVLRLVLTIPLVIYIYSGNHVAACIVAVVAAISDWADGYLARKYEWQTKIGALADTCVDKIYVIFPLYALVDVANVWFISFWMIVIRELAIALGKIIFTHDERLGSVLHVNWWGKVKMTAQVVAIPYAILEMPYYNEVMLITALLTVYSGLLYGWQCWQALSAQEHTAAS